MTQIASQDSDHTMTARPLSAHDATWLLAREIRRLQQRLERLEHGMEHLYSDGSDARLSTIAITAFQELDVLAQSTDALAGYVERLTHHLDKDTALDLQEALRSIPLRDLANRLAGKKEEALTPNAPEMF